ncbi:MAG: HAD family phosphatase [Deltaproteobacteria bacterium]|nr:HAD family phosphatase [Deltaproteobacteria bacterium]
MYLFENVPVNISSLKSPALFFDLDGTLVDSERLHWRAWRTTLRDFNIDLSWQMYKIHAIGHPDPEILDRVCPRSLSRLSGNHILSNKKEQYINLVRTQSPLSVTTIQLLKRLSQSPIAVVTSSPRAEAIAVLEGGGVFQYLRTVICLEDVQKPKPHPEPYLIAMKRLGVSKGIAFEDSQSGKTSAAAAGLEVVEVTSPSSLPDLVKCRLLPIRPRRQKCQ